MRKMGKTGPRSLDTAVPASIDHIALNNQIVGMRKTVKRTKIQLINRMVKRIRVLKNFTKGSDQEIEKRKRKAQRILEEIEVIKKLDPDQVSKYALANTRTTKDLATQPSGSITKALDQYCCHKLMQQVVEKFREKHHDWKALAAYILTKNTGRRYKKKATKEKVTLDAANTKREATDNLLNNFLEKKGSDVKSVTDASSILKEKNQEKQSSQNATKNDSALSVNELKKIVTPFEDSDCDDSEEEVTSKSLEKQSESESVDSEIESSDAECMEVEKIADKELNISAIEKKIVSKQKLNINKTENNAMDVEKNASPKVKAQNKSKHMVIQSFSLENTSEELLQVTKHSFIENHGAGKSVDNALPEFLKVSDSEKKTKSKKKDSFFMGGEDDSDSGTESLNDHNNDRDSNDEDGSDLEQTDQLQEGKVAMRSTFLGSLTDDRKDKMSSWAHRRGNLRHGGRGTEMGRRKFDDFPPRRPWERNDRGGRGRGEREWRGRGARDFSQRGGSDRGPMRGRGRYQREGSHRDERMAFSPQKRHHEDITDTHGGHSRAETDKPIVEEKLHPSWQASKLRKQQTIQSFQGKKTTFEDDD